MSLNWSGVPITRRQLFAAAAAGVPLLAQKREASPPPNIVLILADDLAAFMLGCYGNKEIRTPNIDQLAAGGVRFHNAYACTPTSSPSRATLFTGRTPMQHGIEDFLDDRPIANPPQGQFAPPASFSSETMLSDVLAGQGYRCGYVGKWHMGDDKTPQHKFDTWYTMPGGAGVYQNPSMSVNGALADEKGYLADLITSHARQFLDEQKPGKPFFLTVGHFNPHAPYEGHPQKYYDLYAGTKFDTIGWEPAAPNALRDKSMFQDVVGNLRKCAAAVTETELIALYRSYYAGKPFVRVRTGLPATKDTTGTNYLDVTVKVVRGTIVVLAAEDNLIRGASGVAVQNFNRMFGIDETTGLM